MSAPTGASTAYPQIGDPAPGLGLPDQHGQTHTLEQAVAGRHALLVFYPFAFSSICTGELLEIQLNIDEFVNDRVHVYGVSCDPTYSLRAWGALEGYRFPLLSDFWPHGEVARAFGVFDDGAGMARRGTFLVGPDGRIAWSLVNPTGQARDFTGYHEALDALGRDGSAASGR